MAVAVQKYIKNMAKSVTYTASDVLSTKFEYVKDFKNENQEVSEKEFENEILAQSARHEIYLQTKNIRELMLARAVATSVVASTEKNAELDTEDEIEYNEDEILRDWFDSND